MRLTLSQIDMIRHAAQTVFGDYARVTLFGSRVDDQAKGGALILWSKYSILSLSLRSSKIWGASTSRLLHEAQHQVRHTGTIVARVQARQGLLIDHLAILGPAFFQQKRAVLGVKLWMGL